MVEGIRTEIDGKLNTISHAHTGQKTRPIRLKVRNRLETLWGGKEGGIISKYIYREKGTGK
jgi:hypothetical protein